MTELVGILSNDHAIEELKFVRNGWSKPWSASDAKWIDRTIDRHEFLELVTYLKNCGVSNCKKLMSI